MQLCDSSTRGCGTGRMIGSRLSRCRLLASGGLLVVALSAGGCRPSGDAASDVAVTWEITPDPPRAGNLAVAVALADSLGRPIRGAQVRLEGTMTHPGMQPVLAEPREAAPGRYEATLALSMGGDWVLLLDATLPDGRSVHRQRTLSGVRAP